METTISVSVVKKYFLFLCLLLCLVTPFSAYGYTTGCTPVNGGTCYLASANRADIEAAITAASNGDTIRVSSGSFAVTSTWQISKDLYIMGAADPDAPSAGTTTWTISYDQALRFNSSGFSRFGYHSIANTNTGWNGVIRIDADSKRFDHLTITANYRHTFKAWTNRSDVVVDNCTFSSRGLTFGGGSGYNTTYWENESAFAPGTNAGIYIEDCTFNGSAAESTDAQDGMRYVVRNSTFNDGTNMAMHGADSGLTSAGYLESYGNTFNGGGDIVHVIRGGTALIFNVTETGNYNSFAKLVYQRSCYPCGDYAFAPGENSSKCDSNQDSGTYTTPIDGHDDSTGWLCKQQPGTGPSNSVGGYPGKRTPIYIWENTQDENFGGACFCGGSISDHVKADRDYFSDESGSYQIARVTSAPTTCSYQYQAVWYDADGDGNYDDGLDGGTPETLYQCDGSNYQAYYTPYTYPHPLRTGTISVGGSGSISFGGAN